ncbi:cyclin-domain-containing protein [Trichophaea hybrida]|nr:cyclin-domain-containing protein [Trichophaea hybrida]
MFRHHSTGSHTSAHHIHHSTTTTPIPFDQPGITSSSFLPPSGSLGTVSTSSSTSSTLTAPDPRTPLSPTRAKRASEDTPPILLRNLGHVVELAKDDCLHTHTPPRRNRSGYEDKRRYEISSMPVGDVIEMVAGLLTKITTTNDRQHDHLHRTIPPPDSTAGMSTTTNSVLAFHGKNVPSITIMSYLSRIHKYCPTTYEVFLSLLVYFDRMTDRVNKKHTHSGVGTVTTGEHRPETPTSTSASSAADNYSPSHVFVVDSYNIHRLVIAGVTCASKFFSDVFYTNSRYAKVGGLPLAELNHLELQFLILNDFRLSVPVEELEAYGTMLVQFYAREAIANANLLQQNIDTPPQQQ